MKEKSKYDDGVRLEVAFSGRLSMYNNNTCDGCHAIGPAIMLNIPETRYFQSEKPGKRRLYTKMRSRYYCRTCADKLERVLLETPW